MTSPDFRTFVDSLVPGHVAWSAGPHPAATIGYDFFNHYVGDATHPGGLLWQYESWRSEHGYTEVRPWNGCEALGRAATADLPFPGQVIPYPRNDGGAPGPAIDSRLADGRTRVQLQADFSTTNDLGSAIATQWNTVRTFLIPVFAGNQPEIADDQHGHALYSVRFWGFMKWASILRNHWFGIPVFAIPIVSDADGVPLSDIEFLDEENDWHKSWHTQATICSQVTSQATNNPFAPEYSPYGQFCHERTPDVVPGEFFTFHRDVINTFDNWRRRAGMPPVGLYAPTGLHFHDPSQGGAEVDIPDPVGNDYSGQYNTIKSIVKQFNTLADLANFANGDVHGAGHVSPENPDIAQGYVNNYSPRFFGWHKWVDRIWDIRQPRFNSLQVIESDGTPYTNVVTFVRPTPNPDRPDPNNALTSLTADGKGSLWVQYNIRPETYGRDITLTLSAQVYRNSGDMTAVAGLDATMLTIPVPFAAQGTGSTPVELQFTGLDSEGAGAFTHNDLGGGAVGFKNGRVRITGRIVPVGPVSPGAPADQFDDVQTVDVILIKEQTPPVVDFVLNRSAFSYDEITLTNNAGFSPFANAFFVVLQDPPQPPVAFSPQSIFADPSRTAVAGIFVDPAFQPTVSVVDEHGAAANWFIPVLTDVFQEDPTLPPHVSQRVMFRYQMLVNVSAIDALLPAPGAAPRFAQLKIGARDRVNNQVQNVLSPQIKFFRDAHPYMVDVKGTNPYWLSDDTRVFSVTENEMKFGHSVAASGGPTQYIRDVLAAFNAGTQDFESIPADEGQAPLELLPQIHGSNVYNFALARVRMKTQVAVNDVRVFFRLFTTAISDLSFTASNYPTAPGASPIALLGRTAAGAEIVSIPFFADGRVETQAGQPGASSMVNQPDVPNGPVPGGGTPQFPVTPPGPANESIHYFGAYLDINSDVHRYPAAPADNGPFPSGDCVSIRDILRGQHQCMVAEVFYGPDPTQPNSTPATSDHLAQRNLLIIETDNPGTRATHTVQHSFDIVLSPELFERKRSDMLLNASLSTSPALAMTAMATAAATASARAFAFDELVIFWNNLPPDSEVQVYLPSLPGEYVVLLRNWRRAPGTVRLVDRNTLALTPINGVTYLPIPLIKDERIAGLLTVTLPDTVCRGEVYTLDVMHIRSAQELVLGGFRLTIPVRKASQLYQREEGLLEVFEERLVLTPTTNRWYPILTAQVEYQRKRALDMAQEAAGDCSDGDGQPDGVRIRVILERITILDAYGPLVHGSGHLALIAHVTSNNGGGMGKATTLPASGVYPVHDQDDGYPITINKEIFRGTVTDDLTVELDSAETSYAGRTSPYRRVFSGPVKDWLGKYKPSDEQYDPENVGDWQVWYRIEEL